tara:strand:+ start:609 stop:758 length:150 start_codon:yes stop_codon:yes gene_type:complete
VIAKIKETKMPKVGGKKFSYTKKGKAAAKAYAKRTGKRMTKAKTKKGRY